MRIDKLEDAIFERFRKRLGSDQANCFMSDGAVAPSAYAQAIPQILFVLKEANDPGGGGWDMRDWVQKGGGRAATWNNIARWALALTHLDDPLPWSDVAVINKELRKQTLQNIAFMNLKKIPGGPSSDNSEIKQSAKKNADLLLAQIKLYQADFVICCGVPVFNLLFDHVIPESERSNDRINGTHRCHSFKAFRKSTVIDFWHPQVRGRALKSMRYSDLYTALIDVARSAIKP